MAMKTTIAMLVLGLLSTGGADYVGMCWDLRLWLCTGSSRIV